MANRWNLIEAGLLYAAKDRNRIVAYGLQLQRLDDFHRKRCVLGTCVPSSNMGKEFHVGQLSRLEIGKDEGISDDGLCLAFVFFLEVQSTAARFDVG